MDRERYFPFQDRYFTGWQQDTSQRSLYD